MLNRAAPGKLVQPTTNHHTERLWVQRLETGEGLQTQAGSAGVPCREAEGILEDDSALVKTA